MMKRKPRLLQYAGGVPGGENNPLGARALYLYQGGTRHDVPAARHKRAMDDRHGGVEWLYPLDE